MFSPETVVLGFRQLLGPWLPAGGRRVGRAERGPPLLCSLPLVGQDRNPDLQGGGARGTSSEGAVGLAPLDPPYGYPPKGMGPRCSATGPSTAAGRNSKAPTS